MVSPQQTAKRALLGATHTDNARCLHASGELELASRTESKVVKMMVSSEGTKAAIVGTTDSRKQAQNAD